MEFVEELKNNVNDDLVNRNERAIKKEQELVKNINPQDCLSLNEEDILKYGFFHISPKENIKDMLEDKCKAQIGENSKGYEDKKRAYFAIGALGSLGFINRIIYLTKQMELKNIAITKYNIDKSNFGDDRDKNYREFQNIFSKEDYDNACKKSFEFANKHLEKCGVLLFRINDGVEYDLDEIKNNSNIHARNFHTKDDTGVPKEKIEKFEINGSSNAKDIFTYFVNNVNIDDVRTGTNENEFFENEQLYLKEFKNYIKELQEKDVR